LHRSGAWKLDVFLEVISKGGTGLGRLAQGGRIIVGGLNALGLYL
jgi:hypothetical protein